MKKLNEQTKFNIFSFVSTFARSLIEIFISLYLFKNGYSIKQVLVFYFFVNLFAIPLSYLFVKIGEKTKYIYVMIIGLIAFVLVQILLRNIVYSNFYLMFIALIYSIYRRGYWVARRFYITTVMPTKKTSGLFSIILVLSQIASILAGYVGSVIFSKDNIALLTIISSVLLFLSIIPLFNIKYVNTTKKIDLKSNLRKYNKSNYLIFSVYELNNLLTFIFPLYTAIYIENSYSLAGNLNAITNIAIIIFIIFYGKLLDKNKNYVVISTMLVLLCSIFKLSITNYFVLLVYFVEGIVNKMQNQSINKIYFENRADMDLTHYNLIYQVVECSVRAIATIPLLFISDIKLMIIVVMFIIFLMLIAYIYSTKKSQLKDK